VKSQATLSLLNTGQQMIIAISLVALRGAPRRALSMGGLTLATW